MSSALSWVLTQLRRWNEHTPTFIETISCNSVRELIWIILLFPISLKTHHSLSLQGVTSSSCFLAVACSRTWVVRLKGLPGGNQKKLNVCHSAGRKSTAADPPEDRCRGKKSPHWETRWGSMKCWRNAEKKCYRTSCIPWRGYRRMRWDTWGRPGAVCLVPKDADWRLSLLEPLWMWLSPRMRRREGTLDIPLKTQSEASDWNTPEGFN